MSYFLGWIFIKISENTNLLQEQAYNEWVNEILSLNPCWIIVLFAATVCYESFLLYHGGII